MRVPWFPWSHNPEWVFFGYFKSPVSGLCGHGLIDQTLVNIWSWCWYWVTCFKYPRHDLSLSKQTAEMKWALKPVFPVTESWRSSPSFLFGILMFYLLSVTGDCEQSSVRCKTIFIWEDSHPFASALCLTPHLQGAGFCQELHLRFWRPIAHCPQSSDLVWTPVWPGIWWSTFLVSFVR